MSYKITYANMDNKVNKLVIVFTNKPPNSFYMSIGWLSITYDTATILFKAISSPFQSLSIPL